MSEHRAFVSWSFSGDDYRKGRYSRDHSWRFDGGLTVAATGSPAVVPKPYASAAHVDPEEAYVASLSSCHMLTYLHLASRQGFEVLAYDDEAVGHMTKNEQGVPWVSEVILQPQVRYKEGAAPSPEQEDRLHDGAHHGCFIANSVKSAIVIRPRRS
jgi:organic hydroperoxide reductase OsmC/OhrA